MITHQKVMFLIVHVKKIMKCKKVLSYIVIKMYLKKIIKMKKIIPNYRNPNNIKKINQRILLIILIINQTNNLSQSKIYPIKIVI